MVMENRIEKLNKEIERCILEMEESYPELYRFIDEAPINLTPAPKQISAEDLEKYLASLKSQMSRLGEVRK